MRAHTPYDGMTVLARLDYPLNKLIKAFVFVFLVRGDAGSHHVVYGDEIVAILG